MDSKNERIWQNIAAHYYTATKCLWGPKTPAGWHRNEDEGMYHLWSAYHDAIQVTEKDELLYARILVMMYEENRPIDSYTGFHKYMEPAMEAYEKALATAEHKPTDKELEKARNHYNYLKYELEKTADTEAILAEAYSLIEGMDKLSDFQFHDSKVISFAHDETNAMLQLEYDHVKIRLNFFDCYDICLNGDPTCIWLDEFYCYRWLYNEKVLTFDVGYYKINCKRITAELVS